VSRSHRVADVPQSVATAAAARALFFFFSFIFFHYLFLVLVMSFLSFFFSFFYYFTRRVVSYGQISRRRSAAQQPPTMRPKRSVALARTDIDRRRRHHNVTFGLVYDANGASFKKPNEEKKIKISSSSTAQIRWRKMRHLTKLKQFSF
jgi:hypothetical protein